MRSGTPQVDPRSYLKIRQALQVRADLPRQFHPCSLISIPLPFLRVSSAPKNCSIPAVAGCRGFVGRTATRNSRRFYRPDVQLAQQINVGTNASPGELIVDAKLMEQLTTGYTPS